MNHDRTRIKKWLAFLERWAAPTLPADPDLFVRETLGYQFTDFHRRWWRFTAANPVSLLLAPRGHGKSTILTVAYGLYRLLAEPELRLLIASNTGAQAEGFLREIRRHLEQNPHILRAAGALAGRPWNERELALASRLLAAKEPSATALGVLGPVISRHYDLIVLDDVVDEEAARSALGRRRLLTWYYKELLPTLEPGGELHVIGTRYHQDDLYGRLLRAGAPSLVERAIIEEDGRERALWEEKFPLEVLRRKREEAGPAIFDSQYQNDVAALSGRVFRPEWLEVAAPPACGRKFQGVDLAIGREDHNDWFAVVTLGEEAGRYWVLSAFRARLSFEEQFRAVRALFLAADRMESPVVAVGIEANAYQEALCQRLRAETALPVVSVVQTRDKVARAMRLTGLLQSGRLRLAERGGEAASELLAELLSFPEGEHDDLVDALELAARMAAECVRYSELPLRTINFAPDR